MTLRVSAATNVTETSVLEQRTHRTSVGTDHALVADNTVSAVGPLDLTAIGEVSAPLSGSAASLFKPQRAVFTLTASDCPAFIKGGTAAQTVIATWAAVNNGSFRIVLSGVGTDVVDCDFSAGPVANMDEVAAVIETQLQAATAGAETVIWDTNHFVITSDDPVPATSSVEALVVHSGPVGTDIHGAGFMDCHAAGTAIELHNPPDGVAGRVRIGTAAGGAQILPISDLPGLIGNDQAFEVALTGLFESIAGNANIFFEVTAVDTQADYLMSVTCELKGTQS